MLFFEFFQLQKYVDLEMIIKITLFKLINA